MTDEYVCLSVCLPVREDISGTTRAIFPKIFVDVAYVRGLVVLRHLDDRPHRLSVGRVDRSAQCGRSVMYNCLVCTVIFILIQKQICHSRTNVVWKTIELKLLK